MPKPVFTTVPDVRVTPLQGVISLNNANYRVEAGGRAGRFVVIASETGMCSCYLPNAS
jgi:hypothetical protein